MVFAKMYLHESLNLRFWFRARDGFSLVIVFSHKYPTCSSENYARTRGRGFLWTQLIRADTALVNMPGPGSFFPDTNILFEYCNPVRIFIMVGAIG